MGNEEARYRPAHQGKVSPGFRELLAKYGASYKLTLAGENCTILLADMVGFNALDRTDQDRQILRRESLQMMQAALGLLTQEYFLEDRGDGFLIVIPPQVPTGRVVESVLRDLPRDLRVHNQTYSPEARIRLLLAVVVGPVSGDDHGLTGESIIRAARLVDAPVVRKEMSSTEAVLGVVVSDFAYETAIKYGRDFTGASEYKIIEVDKKESRSWAWMRLFS
jgi:class 3 adenylate cyclase